MDKDFEEWLNRKKNPKPKNYRERVQAGQQEDWLSSSRRKQKPMKKTALKKTKKRMKQVSNKQRTRLSKYSDEKCIYLADHPICEVLVYQKEKGVFEQMPQIRKIYEGSTDGYRYIHCKLQSTEIHHKARRGFSKDKTIDFLTDPRWFLAVCSNCHKYIEEHKNWAIQHGFTIAAAEIDKI